MRTRLPRLVVLAVLVTGCDRGQSKADGAAEGAKLFASMCARCHGAKGLGGVPQAGGVVSRNLSDPAFQNERTDAELREVIRQGKPPAMPAFAKVLDERQIDKLIAHLRSLPQ